jgi:hypothetical protein
MSLGHVLSACRREKVPAHLLQQCRPADAVVVENILTVVQDSIPCTNIPHSVLRVHSGVYEITVPAGSAEVSLQQLLAVQNYSPARIADIKITVHDGALALVLSVCDETKAVMCSDVSIVRICKRSKR